MIKEVGMIEVSNKEESLAVQKILFDGSRHWSSAINKEREPIQDGNLRKIYWKEKEVIGAVHFPYEYQRHTLSDFGLLPGGNPMLTMEDIEVGGKYVVRKDLKVGEKYCGVPFVHPMIDHIGKVVIVEEISDDPLYDCFSIIGGGRYAYTPAMLSHRVESHLEEAARKLEEFEEAARKPRFEFGDKVKVEGVEEPAHVIVEVNGKVHCSTTFGFHINEHNCGSYTARFFDKAKVSPWPKKETIELSGCIIAKLGEKIELDCLCNEESFELTYDELDTLTSAAAKIRKP